MITIEEGIVRIPLSTVACVAGGLVLGFVGWRVVNALTGASDALLLSETRKQLARKDKELAKLSRQLGATQQELEGYKKKHAKITEVCAAAAPSHDAGRRTRRLLDVPDSSDDDNDEEKSDSQRTFLWNSGGARPLTKAEEERLLQGKPLAEWAPDALEARIRETNAEEQQQRILRNAERCLATAEQKRLEAIAEDSEDTPPSMEQSVSSDSRDSTDHLRLFRGRAKMQFGCQNQPKNAGDTEPIVSSSDPFAEDSTDASSEHHTWDGELFDAALTSVSDTSAQAAC